MPVATRQPVLRFDVPPQPADFIRARLRAALQAWGTLSALRDRLNADAPTRKWSVSRLSRLLAGQIPLTVDECVLIVYAAGLSLVDIMRQPGREFVGDLSADELQLLQRVRRAPHFLEAFDQVLTLYDPHPGGPERPSGKPRPPRPRRVPEPRHR
jgi:hypothetical protein